MAVIWRLAVPFAWLALLGLSIALAVLAAEHNTLPADVRIMTWAQDLAFPGSAFSKAIRAITATEVVLGTGGAIVLLLWLRGGRREAILLAAGLVLLPLIQAGLKELVDRPRPSEPLVDLRAGYSSASFPSGHVMSAIYLYGFLLWLSIRSEERLALRLLVGAWSAFVLVFAGPPNVWLGVHWPSDVLGGWAWALALLLPLLYIGETLRTRAAAGAFREAPLQGAPTGRPP